MVKDKSNMDLIKASAKAHKELLRYIQLHSLTEEEATEDNAIHGEVIGKLQQTIRLARQASFIERREHYAGQVKVHHLKTKPGVTPYQKRKAREKEEEARHSVVFSYPEEVNPLSDNLKDKYRRLFTLHLNSGMDKEKAEEYALRDLQMKKY